jgi:hypothetical protein
MLAGELRMMILMRDSSGTYNKMALGLFVLGIVFLGTTGVQFVIDGNSKGATGTVIGAVAVRVGVHNWIRAKRAECQWPSVSPHWRPSFLPIDGHVFSPLVATKLPTVRVDLAGGHEAPHQPASMV